MAKTKNAFLKRLFQAFIDNEPGRVQETRDALHAKNFNHLQYLAHSIKGASAATLGPSA